MINPLVLPSVDLKDRALLPKCPGIYFCMSGWNILYIGKSENIRLRWNSPRFGNHHKLHELLDFEEASRTQVKIHFWQRPLWRLSHDEAVMIKKYDPPMNNREEPLVWWVSVYDWLMDSLKIGCAIVLLYFVWSLLTTPPAEARGILLTGV